jgi:hypothetical protein
MYSFQLHNLKKPFQQADEPVHSMDHTTQEKKGILGQRALGQRRSCEMKKSSNKLFIVITRVFKAHQVVNPLVNHHLVKP